MQSAYWFSFLYYICTGFHFFLSFHSCVWIQFQWINHTLHSAHVGSIMPSFDKDSCIIPPSHELIFLILQLLSTHFFLATVKTFRGGSTSIRPVIDYVTIWRPPPFCFVSLVANEYLNRNGREYSILSEQFKLKLSLQGSRCNHATIMYLLALGLIGSSTAGHSKRWHYQNSNSYMYIYILVLLFKKRV